VIKNKNLVVKESQIPDSGLGLFTLVTIKAGKTICEFTGELLTNEELNGDRSTKIT
jgi:hypothetical protein